MEDLTSDISKKQYKCSKAVTGLPTGKHLKVAECLCIYTNCRTYKLSSSLFKDSKTNEWTLSKEQDPKQFRAEIYLIFITQSLCSFLLTLGIKKKKKGELC